MENQNSNLNITDGDDGLICAFLIDKEGGGSSIGWNEIEHDIPSSELQWIHLDYEHDTSKNWLFQRSGLDTVVSQGLTADDPRPRCVTLGKGVLIVLRGVNLNEGAAPDDMVSLRIWMEPNRIITLRRRRVMAVTDIRLRLENRAGPKGIEDFLIQLIGCLTNRLSDVVADTQEKADKLEERVLETGDGSIRKEIADLRRQSITLRRYITPQKEALLRMVSDKIDLITDLTRIQLREYADRLTKYLEDLEATRDRTMVTQEELNSRNSERMNRAMYLISIFTAIFLPLGLLTGLLGMNVGGMPGIDSAIGFWVVCGILATMLGIQMVIFRKNGWF